MLACEGDDGGEGVRDGKGRVGDGSGDVADFRRIRLMRCWGSSGSVLIWLVSSGGP